MGQRRTSLQFQRINSRICEVAIIAVESSGAFQFPLHSIPCNFVSNYNAYIYPKDHRNNIAMNLSFCQHQSVAARLETIYIIQRDKAHIFKYVLRSKIL